MSRKEGCLQNIICCAVQRAAIQDTVTLRSKMQGLQWTLTRQDRRTFFSHLHRFWCLSVWKVLSAMSCQIHHRGCCYSGLGVEEVSGSFISTGVAAKLAKMIKKDDLFFAYLASELCRNITQYYTPAFNSSRVRKSQVLEMTLTIRVPTAMYNNVRTMMDMSPLNLVVYLSSRHNLLLQQRCKNSFKKRLQSREHFFL